MKRRCGIASVVVAGTLVAACGGGGDDDGRAATPLSLANFDDVSQQVTDSVAATGPLFSALELVADADSDRGRGVFLYPLASGQVGTIAGWALRRGMPFAEPTLEQTQQAVEGVCISGGLDVTVDDADGNETLSRGDSLTLVASSCVLGAGQPAVNGSLRFSFDAVVLSGEELVSATVTLRFATFSSAGVTLNGAATVSTNDSGFSLAYRGLTAVTPARSLTYNHTIAVSDNGGYDDTATVSGTIVVNSSSYQLATPSMLVLGPVYPKAGMLQIADGHGSRARVSMSLTGYTSQLYLPGDEVVDGTVTHLWTDV